MGTQPRLVVSGWVKVVVERQRDIQLLDDKPVDVEMAEHSGSASTRLPDCQGAYKFNVDQTGSEI